MEPNMHNYQIQAGMPGTSYLLEMIAAEDMKRAREKTYIRLGGETFYIGKLPDNRHRTGLFRRILRRIRNRR